MPTGMSDAQDHQIAPSACAQQNADWADRAPEQLAAAQMLSLSWVETASFTLVVGSILEESGGQ
jgi:hypothetical protein